MGRLSSATSAPSWASFTRSGEWRSCRSWGGERDELVEHGDAEPAEFAVDSPGVSHDLRGPSDVTGVLELFDRRYRDIRGEGEAYSSEDPGYPHGRFDQL